MKQVLTTIYYSHDEEYPVVRLAPKGRDTGEEAGYYRVKGQLYSYKAKVPADVAANYRAAVASYHAATVALNRAIDAYEKTLPPREPGRFTGVSSE